MIPLFFAPPLPQTKPPLRASRDMLWRGTFTKIVALNTPKNACPAEEMDRSHRIISFNPPRVARHSSNHRPIADTSAFVLVKFYRNSMISVSVHSLFSRKSRKTTPSADSLYPPVKTDQLLHVTPTYMRPPPIFRLYPLTGTVSQPLIHIDPRRSAAHDRLRPRQHQARLFPFPI